MTTTESQKHFSQLRLFLEELCSDLCRFEHSSKQVAPHDIRIDREFDLGKPEAYADLRVCPPNEPPFFLEVKYGYADSQLLQRIRTKYSTATAASQSAGKLVLVVDSAHRPNWPQLEKQIQASLHAGLQLEVWDEARFLGMLHKRFQVCVDSISPQNLLDVRHAIDRAKGAYAFGDAAPTEFENDPLSAALIWHFGFWRLRELREAGGLGPREILPPGDYRGVVVLMGDLCSFSSYVRDTPDSEIIRENLTAFYSKSRYQIIDSGGMLDKFVGDEVIGMFGLPYAQEDSASRALAAAKALRGIGTSISQRWQRCIDRVQNSKGLHLGMAVGDLQIVALRPYSRTHIGAIGDCINVAARLMKLAGPNEIVVSNSLYQQFRAEEQADFSETEPVEAHNVGRIKAWKLG